MLRRLSSRFLTTLIFLLPLYDTPLPATNILSRAIYSKFKYHLVSVTILHRQPYVDQRRAASSGETGARKSTSVCIRPCSPDLPFYPSPSDHRIMTTGISFKFHVTISTLLSQYLLNSGAAYISSTPLPAKKTTTVPPNSLSGP